MDARKSAWMTESERVEAGRRARAAVAYTGLEKREFAELVPWSESTLSRIFDGTRSVTSWDDFLIIADACVVHPDWFTCDPLRLSEIVLPGLPTFGASEDLEARMARELESAVLLAREQRAAAAKGKHASEKTGRPS